MEAGLACGMGYIGYAVLFDFILCAVMVILEKVRFGEKKSSPMRLKVTPEDMNYHGAFDGIFKEHTVNFRLCRVKTSEFGSLFEITYEITLKDMADSKCFMDKIRCKNGNLNVVLSIKENNEFVSF